MQSIRCKRCNRLLMQAIVVEAEIKCPKCGLLQKISCTEAPKHVSMFSSSTKGMVVTAI